MSTNRRRLIRLYVPALVIALALLYLALLDVQSSTADMMPRVMTFDSTQPAGPQDITAASHVLVERFSSYLPNDVQPAVSVEGDRLAVSLPSNIEPSIVVAEARRVGRVELVDGGNEFLPLNGVVETGSSAIPDQGVYQAVLSSADFELAEARLKDGDHPVIDFVLSPAGDARLSAHTTGLHGYYLCLVVDNRVVNCPIVRTPLMDRRGTIELTGDATPDDAQTWAMLLRSGPLPVRLRLASD